jgi:alcohol dehydrogenase class IV
MPIAAVCDYELTMSMPFRLTADTGIDTMCHAMEAYVSKKHNPFSDQVGLSCLDAVGKYLRTACNEPSNEGAREAMMLAATQGGMAFSNSSVTLVHGMSRPLGVFFHIPHGMSNAMLVPEVTNWSVEACVERYAQCCRILGMCDQGATDKDAASALPKCLDELCQELKVPTLQEFGVKKEKFFEVLPTMATMAIGSGSPGNNPKVPSEEEIIAIYTKIWNIGEEVTAKRAAGGYKS